MSNMMKPCPVPLHSARDPHGPVIQDQPKQMVLLLMYLQKVHRSAVLDHNTYLIHLLHLITRAFYHLTSSGEGWVQCSEIS